MEQNNEQTNQTIEQGTNFLSDAKFLEAIAKAQENKAKVTAYVGEVKDIPKVEEGQFTAITIGAIYDLSTKTKSGLKACVKVSYLIFDSNRAESVELTMPYWVTPNNTSAYVKQLSTLLGADVKKGFHVSDLIGKCCQVQIKHTPSKDGRIFANVEELSLLNLPTDSTSSINL